VVGNINASHQQTRDALSSEPSTHQIYQIRNESVQVELANVQIIKKTIGHSFILGSSINGVLGVWTVTADGQQLGLGEQNIQETVVGVYSPANKFVERFTFDNFKNSSTNADWDTANHKLYFSGAIGVDTAVSERVGPSDDSQTVVSAKLIVDDSDSNLSSATLYLSADSGSNWEEVTNNTWHNFTNTGNDLRWKIFISLTPLTVRWVRVEYNTV